MNNELIWKDIEGFNGVYQISNTGEVKTVDRVTQRADGKTYHLKGKTRKTYISKVGYLCVSLPTKKGMRSFYIHRLLAEAFIPNPENKPCVDHINTIMTDNRLENLRWVTHKENTRNPLTYKKLVNELTNEDYKKKSIEIKRHKYGKIKYIYQFTLDGHLVARYSTSFDAQRTTGIYCTSIRKVCRGEQSTAGGYVWSYDEQFYLRKYNHHGFGVCQKDKRTGKVIEIYDSLTKTAKANGVSIAKIQRMIDSPLDKDEFIFERTDY